MVEPDHGSQNANSFQRKGAKNSNDKDAKKPRVSSSPRKNPYFIFASLLFPFAPLR